jgi:hypothetical protein
MMWSLLGSLISSFLLLRDLFGYAIPGAVLLGSVDYFEKPDFSNVPMIHESVWLEFVVAVTASYVVGHILAAIGYLPYDICTGKRTFEAPTQQAKDALFYRYLYPSMFIDADRRETLTILRICLSVAIILVALLPAFPAPFRVLALVIGAFMLGNAYLSLAVAKRAGDAALEAAKAAKAANIPYFNWSSDGAKSKNGGGE